VTPWRTWFSVISSSSVSLCTWTTKLYPENGRKSLSTEPTWHQVARILRHLAVNHVLQEVSASVYKPTAFSLSLLQPVFGEWINYL
jgi:hypothetical protein